MLECSFITGNKLIAACPACRNAGHDKTGNHLIIYREEDGTFESGRYGCVANEGDELHRKEIFSLVGVNDHLFHISKLERINRARIAALNKRKRIAIEREKESITARLLEELEEELEPYISPSWEVDLLDTSIIRFDSPGHLRHDFVRSLFSPSDLLWIGDMKDSGSPKHAKNFKYASEWLKLEVLPPRIAAATFKSGSISRSNANVITSPYIVVECDEMIGRKPITPAEKELNKQLSAALVKMFVNKHGLTLRSVIDTGNKSLHSWFDRPEEGEMEALLKLAQGYRIDTDLLRHCSSSPLRLPLCPHDKTGNQARLLFLNPKPISYK